MPEKIDLYLEQAETNKSNLFGSTSVIAFFLGGLSRRGIAFRYAKAAESRAFNMRCNEQC
jgi:hypothetical protein